jgi:isopropylmalate/homocitrate/citramalate synthase
VNGYCSGPGQADEQQVITALEILCGIDTGIDLTGLTDLRRLGEDISRVKMGRSHPITGDEAFNWGGADDVMLELQVDPLIHLAVAPEVVGNVYSTSIVGSVVDRSSGPWAVMNKLDELGLKPEREEVELIHTAIQDELLVRKRSLSNEEIRELAISVVPRLGSAS